MLWRESRVHWHLEASGRLRFIKQNLKVVDPCCCYSILLYVPSTIYDFVCSKYLVWKLTKTRAKGKWANKKFDFKVQSKPTGSHWAKIGFHFPQWPFSTKISFYTFGPPRGELVVWSRPKSVFMIYGHLLVIRFTEFCYVFSRLHDFEPSWILKSSIKENFCYDHFSTKLEHKL